MLILLGDQALYLLSYSFAQLSRRRRTSEIRCMRLPICQNLFDGSHKESSCLALAKEIK